MIGHVNSWSIVNKIWSSILQKWSGSNLHQIVGSFFAKKPYFRHSENEKWIFRATKVKSSFGKLVGHSNMHTFTKYEITWQKYPLKLAITSVIWLEKPWIFILFSSFWEDFFQIFALFQVCYFIWLLGHKWWCNAKVLHFFDFCGIVYVDFKMRSKRGAWPVIARGGILQNSWWIYDEMTTCVPRNDFLKI